MTPSPEALARARAQVAAFEAARARGEDRALFDGQWLEVPTWRNALRLIERAPSIGAGRPRWLTLRDTPRAAPPAVRGKIGHGSPAP